VTPKGQSRDPIIFVAPYHTSQDSVSVVKTTFKVYRKRQNLTLSQPKTPEPIVTKLKRRDYVVDTKNVNKMCFCALFRLSSNTTLGKMQYFIGADFSR